MGQSHSSVSGVMVAGMYGMSPSYVQENLDIEDIEVLKGLPGILVEKDMVHFMPLKNKGANYLKFGTGWLSASEIPSRAKMVSTVVQYTCDPICYSVNCALATDFGPKLQKLGPWIRNLKYTIGKMGGWSGPLWRGVDLTKEEFQEMVDLGDFYIPSFTSTTRTRDKHFKKNTILSIDASDATWTLCMTEELSPEYYSEDEVLISCYSRYRLISHSMKGGTRLVSLKVLKQ